MGKLTDFLKRIRLVYRPASRKTKKILLCGILLSLAAVLVVNLTVGLIRDNYEKARKEAAALEAEKADKQDKIDGLGSADGVEQAARDELGLVDPDTTIVVPDK